MFISTHGFSAVLAAYAGSVGLGQAEWASPLFLTGAFVCGLLPDLPVAVLILSGRFDPQRHHHHAWITHTPFFWLCVAGVLALISPRAGVLLGGATLLHLGMDWMGGGDGLPFLFPFSRRQFGVRLTGEHRVKPIAQYFIGGPRAYIESALHVLGGIVFLTSL